MVAAAAPTARRAVACALVGSLLGLTQGFGLHLVGSNLPAIQGGLGATAAEASWLTTAYFATALSSTLLLVKVRLHWGLEAFARYGLLGFLAVAALHLTSDTLASAVVARAALGFVAAPLSTLAVLYMLEAFPRRLAPVGLVLGFAALQIGMPLSRVVSPALLDDGPWHRLFFFEVALAVLSLAAILALRLEPQPRARAFSRGDAVSFPLYAAGLGFLCVAVSQGRLRWWTDTWWIGACLAAAIGCLALYVVCELNRSRPLLDLRWLSTPYMLRFVAAVLLFRIVLAEQNVAMVGLMSLLGQANEQMRTLFVFAAAAMLAGFLLSLPLAARAGPRWLAPLAALLVAAAAWLDGGSTALTRPAELLASQALLSGALAVFFVASLLMGFGPVLKDGMRQIVSLLAAFSGAQYLGSLLGAAWISTYVAERQTWHYAALAQHLSLDDPQTALRLRQLAGALAGHVSDTAARGAQATASFARQVTSESFVLAYNDVFQAIALLSLLMAAWLGALALRGARRERAAFASAAAAAPAALDAQAAR